MSANAEKATGLSKLKPEETVVDFDPDRLKAPFLLRCGAFFVDYIVLLAVPVISLLVGRVFGIDGTKLLTSEISNTGWLVMVLLGLTNLVIFPMFGGQSLGKMMTGIRIVRTDGAPATFGTLILRHTLGYLLTVGSAGIGFVLAALTPRGRAIHDYLAGTVVIYGKRRIRSGAGE